MNKSNNERKKSFLLIPEGQSFLAKIHSSGKTGNTSKKIHFKYSNDDVSQENNEMKN